MPLSSSISKKYKTKVYFFFQDVKVSLANRTRLKRFIHSIFKREDNKLESLNYVFCTDKTLLSINRQYLKHDYYTDIITFNLSENGPVKAEIYISIDRVRENARNLGIPVKSEIHRVMFHGVLHLCGYSDKNKAEKGKMREKEDLYLAHYF
ncbi:MAG: rRNA maturation RNase YbeY [Ferruginibacter sp.]|nr:rRNA maturation RNase YbeY [Chitinophagaceae bacterium]